MAKEKETWHGGISDCCEAPIKEVGDVLTILICSECKDMCNVKQDDDDFPDDFFDNED